MNNVIFQLNIKKITQNLQVSIEEIEENLVAEVSPMTYIVPIQIEEVK